MSRYQKSRQEKKGASWITTYGDMVTLLLTFFVMLYSFSVLDTEKYSQVSSSLRSALGGNTGILEDGNAIIPLGSYAGLSPEMQEVFDSLQQIADDEGLEDKVELTVNERGIVLSFKEKLSFSIGSADILNEAYPFLNEVGSVFRGKEFPIRIEGHTCDIPIKNYKYPSNWELSAIRAVNVGRFLIERSGIEAERISTVAYGQYQPIVPNTSEENRARNRRVDVVLLNTKSE